MKKFNLLVIGLLAMFGFTAFVSAENGVSLKCDNNQIKIGQTTNCVVSITTDSAVSATTITLDTSEYLDVTNITANSSAGWTASTTGTNATTHEYAFNNTTGSTGTAQVFSFNVTLNEGAKNLSEGDSCGQLCISAVTFDGAKLAGVLQGTGTCFAPTVVVEQCVGENCNPKTGAFANYIIIGVVAIVALGTILVVRKSNKFYRV